MEEKNEVMVNNDVEVLDNDSVDLEECSSGNTFNKGVAAGAALLIGGLVAGGIAIRNKIKKKKEAKAAGTPEGAQQPEDKPKGLRIGKKRLQIVTIDDRTQPEETPKQEK